MIDFHALLAGLALDVISMLLSIAMVLSAVTVVVGAAAWALLLIRGESQLTTDLRKFFDARDSFDDGREFRRRYRRESANWRYAEWKKAKGY